MPRIGMRTSLINRVRLDYVMRNLRMGRVVIGGGRESCSNGLSHEESRRRALMMSDYSIWAVLNW